MNAHVAATGIQTVRRGGRKDTELGGQSGEPQTDPHRCAPTGVPPTELLKQFNGRRVAFSQILLEKLHIHRGKKRNLMNPILIKTISKWIMNLNMFVRYF